MACFRIDNRLVHGQVIEAWLPYTDARHLIVANDDLAENIFCQQIIALAVPQRVKIHFVPLSQLAETLAHCGDKSFVLFASCQDAYTAYQNGVAMPELNIGNLHYAEGKRQLLPHVAVSAEDTAALCALRAADVLLDFRCVPTETVRGLDVQL
jgi:mannose/fructose/N-acetylgalactosamine-specific phosphotransferase system component IIB